MICKDQFCDRLTPFVCLRGRLSQVLMAPGIAVLVIMIMKLQLLRSTIVAGFADAFVAATEFCHEFQTISTQAANASRAVTLMANQIVAHQVQDAINSTKSVLQLFVIGTKQLLLFVIEIYIGTWACLTFALIHSMVDQSLSVAKSVISATNSTLSGAVNDIDSDLRNLNDLVNGATGLIGTIQQFVTGAQSNISKLNVTANGLRNIAIPADIYTKIDSWKSNIPTYDAAKQAMDEVISVPFSLIENQINNSTSLTSNSFHKAILPVPAAKNVSACNLVEIKNALMEAEHFSVNVVDGICGLVGVLIVCVMIFYIYEARCRWHRLETAAERMDTLVGRSAELQHQENVSAILAATRSGIVSRALSLVPLSGDRRTRVLWYLQYTMLRPAATCLLIGIAGLFVSLLEFSIIRAFLSVASDVTHNVQKMIGTSANQSFYEVNFWFNHTNTSIVRAQNDINHELLGWVVHGSQSVNNTLATFMSSIDKDLKTAFGNTTIYDSAMGAVDCIFGKKVDMIEKGLTWVHSKAFVTLPRLPDGALQSLQNATTAVSLARADIGLEHLAESLLHQVKLQACMSTLFVGLWSIFAAGAAVVVFSSHCAANTRQKTFESLQNETSCWKPTSTLFEGPEAKTVHQVASPRHISFVPSYGFEY